MSFTYDLDTTCFEEVGIQFNSTSSPGDSCYWDFMDGSPITPGCDLTHVMGEIGTFYPLLTHCHYGCCDTISQGPITINPPQAAFVDSFTCATPLTRYVRSTSTRATHYFWDFGDPNRTDDTANTATATWVYDSSGCYVITLTAYNDTFDCYHSVTRNRCIYDPIAQVTVNDSFICRGQQITFQNISPFSVSGNLLTTRWDFDYQGGAPSYEPSNFLQYKIQNYTYFLPGIYSVVMQNRTPNGCRDTIRKEDWITVHGAYASQSASVTQGCMPLTVTFTDLSYAPLTYIDSIVWDFGDGSPPNSDSIVTHTYTSAGTYNARITVWDSAGCTHSSVQTIVVQHPNVSFNPSDTFICGGQSITFTNTSSGVGLGHQWTFPGVPPVTSTATSPTVTFPDTGVVRVRLVTTDNLGCRDSAFQNIYIRNPVANFGIAAVGLDCPPVFVQFIDSSLNNVVAWQWSYDNNTVSSTLQNPSHTYNRPIVDTISLVITTGSGCTDTVIKPAVSVGGPYISATSEVLDSCIPVRVAYYVQSVRTDTVRAIFPGTGRGAEIFTPGCYGTPSAPCIDTFIITYNQAGSYPIQFVIRDTAGCTRLETLNLPVVNVDTPSAQFNIAFGNICGGGTINLSDASFAGPGGYAITNWDWDFGDGTTSTQQNPNHLYTGPGTFPISLVVTNSIGCTDTSSRPFVVPVDPVARIFTFDTNACVPATIQFYDSTIADTLVAEWDWSFGTMGATSTLQNPTYTYNSVGSFTVSLSVRDSLGCTDTGTFTVTINSIPNVDAGIDTAHCFGDSIQLSASGALTYSWQSNPYLSDTSVSNPFVSVDSLTTFYVTGTDINGCSASDSVIVDMDRVFPFFTFDTVCLGDTTFFTDQSSNLTGSLSSWVWDFDDQGMTSNAQNPFHIFSSDSVYDVTLTVTDNRGCQQDTTISVPISPKPTANFGPDRSCFGDSTLFTDLSQANTGVLVSWAWDFGDGSTDTLRNPVHFYQNPGTYQVCLTVINSSLCAGQDDTCKNIEVTTKPTALFSVDTACLGDDNSFVDQSIDNGGVGLLGWSWDFDTMNPGAQTSIQQNPVNTYIGSGTFPVSLQVTDSAGCSGDTVLPAFVYDIPVASFVGDTVCLGDSICPIDQSSQGTLPILNWSWDMDTSTGIFISGQSPCVLYNTAGQRIVRLAVTDAFGCTDTAFNSVRTVDVVSAAFSTDTVCAGSATQFTDLSTTAFGSVVSWFYDFADGDSAFTANPSHVYQSGGIYPVTLRATTDLGCFHDTTIDVKVYLLPTASFQVDTTCIGDSTFFADASIDNGDGAISGWLWDLDLSNPGANLSVADSPAFIYPALGNYNFSLTVTDVNGCTDDSSGVVTLVGLPTARFTSDSACIQDSICIVDQSIPNAGSLAGWDWQFDINDTGSFLSGQAPCYEYPDSGNYIIRLTVTDRFGCQDDTTNNVVVSSIPRAFFVADSVCLGDTTFFVDQSISDFGSLTDYRWSFGDGDTSILQNPFHVYDSAGVYNVRLTVRNPIGCPHDTIIPVVVYGIPIADFIGDTVCFGDTTFFIDSSTNQPWGNIVGWTWDLDTANIGSSTFNIQNPFTVYPSQGTYWVSLEVVDEHGCVGDTLKPVSLYQLPVARFTPDTVCLGDTICLADSSIPGTGVLNGFAWDMGDGTQLTGSNICHVYSDSGSYQVHLQVSDDRGCTADTTLTNRVQNLPWADFSFLPTCSGDSTRFFDGSLAGQGVLTNWFWDFDDGDTSNLQDPIHIYPNGDTFTVTLTVTNQFGCSDDRSNILPILQGPIPDFLFDTVCFGDSTHFFDNSSNGAGVNAMWIWDFGTGDSSMVQNPVYLFPNDTVFNVRLTVLDTNNCVARVNKDVLVFTLPQAEFTTSNLCFRSAIDFTDQSVPGSNPISTWFWDFDDNGATSTQQNPSHNFSAPANYDLQLVVEDTRGCIDTLDRTLRINPQPVGDFVFSRDIACVGEQVCLTDSSTANGSTGGIGAWAWDFNFNSGIDNTTQNPCTSYNSSGTYTVRLIVTDTNQCRDTIDREIRVFDLPTADFDWSVSCVDSPMVFTDFSLPGDTTITAWFWDFGDNVQDIVQNPSHAYATPGFFNVNLEVTDANVVLTILPRLLV
jgi:PKD repeat protein